MVSPADYDVTTYINDVDVTQYVPFNKMEIDDNATEISWFRFTVENPSGVTPQRGHSVKVVENTGNTIVFLGNIIELETSKRDNGITIEYQVDAADYKHRLEKSILDIAELSGTDASILSGLISNGYPDLSSIIDFSSGVTGFATGLTLPTGDKSIMDALKELSELAGGADWRIANVTGSGSDTITFNSATDTWINYPPSTTRPYFAVDNTGSLTPSATISASGGNSGHCAVYQPTSGTSASNTLFRITIRLYGTGETATLNNILLDYYVDSDVASTSSIRIIVREQSAGSSNDHEFTSLTSGTWTSLNAANDGGSSLFPVTIGNNPSLTDIQIYFEWNAEYDASAVNFDYRFDNIELDLTPAFGGGSDISQLKWDFEPDLADFNLNIDTSDEFGYDFNLREGDFDDYNSITVIGGSRAESKAWVYESDGYQDHFDLELPISITAIEENTGTDMSPSWSALTVGTVGEDELGVGGIDVLYDPEYHWLEFDSNPPALGQSFRVTGTIKRPIRVRVENITGNSPVYATTYYDNSITSEEQALAIGASKLDKNNAARFLTFTTHEPGLKAGQQITVTDSSRSLAETAKIQRVKTKWLSGKLAVFDVECGESPISTGVDLIAGNDKRSRTQSNAGISVTSFSVLTDADDIVATDAYGRKVYGIAT